MVPACWIIITIISYSWGIVSILGGLDLPMTNKEINYANHPQGLLFRPPAGSFAIERLD
jgi:hypothetical protein